VTRAVGRQDRAVAHVDDLLAGADFLVDLLAAKRTHDPIQAVRVPLVEVEDRVADDAAGTACDRGLAAPW